MIGKRPKGYRKSWRPCTCHPDEAPLPCQRKYALSECLRASALSGGAAGDQLGTEAQSAEVLRDRRSPPPTEAVVGSSAGAESGTPDRQGGQGEGHSAVRSGKGEP